MGTSNSNNATLTVYDTGLPCGSGYGTSRYDGSYKAECSLRSKRHYYALKKIFPIKYLEGELDNDLDIEGYWLDECEESGWQLNDEMFADTTQLLLSSWERLYGIDIDGTETLAERRNAVVAERRATGGLSIDYYESVASGLGYSITIVEGLGNLFVVADTSPPATTLPNPLYDTTERWTWTVHVAGVSSAADLEKLFKEIAPAHTRVEFSYAP